MSEVIPIHIGQTGVQIGKSFWELLCLEHGIQQDGQLDPEQAINQDNTSVYNFFSETSTGKFVPRALFVDLEPTVIDQIRMSPYYKLYNPSNLISGQEDASCNYARGYYTVGREIFQIAFEQLRKLAESCSRLQGFIYTHSFSGGTGTGLTSQFASNNAVTFGRTNSMNFPVFPSPNFQSAIVDPYNAILATHAQIDYIDNTVCLDNESLYKICSRELGIERPTFSDVNQLISQVISSITAPIRFNDTQKTDLFKICVNNIDYHRIHFNAASYAPFASSGQNLYPEQMSVADITYKVFQPHNYMLSVDPKDGKYLNFLLNYRGDVIYSDIFGSIESMKDKLMFVDYAPTGFKANLCNRPPKVAPFGKLAKTQRAVSNVINTTAIGNVFENIRKKFNILYRKRAYVHWYVGEGMEEAEFPESEEDVQLLIMDYKECATDSTLDSEYSDQDA